MGFLLPLAVYIVIFNLALLHGSAEVIYEDGYTVTTVLDCNKLKINPRSLSPLPGSRDILLLDLSHSQFHTLSIPLSQQSEIKKFAGKGLAGFSDGDASTAMFNKPKSYAVDQKGNVYVADQSNFAIRKISKSGAVTTIAGGYSKTAGHTDGPGRNATFSASYELTYVPSMCALLITDHGIMSIRQINLKQEDCARSDSGVGVPLVWPWVTAVVVSCLAGVLVGFIIHPYVMPHAGRAQLPQHQQVMDFLPNESGESNMDELLRHQKRSC